MHRKLFQETYSYKPTATVIATSTATIMTCTIISPVMIANTSMYKYINHILKHLKLIPNVTQ